MIYAAGLVIALILALQLYKLRGSYFGMIGPFLVSRQATFTNGSRSVTLVGMIHVANQSFYDSVKRDFDNKKYLALTEGVRGRRKESDVNPYASFAKRIGVAVQTKDLFTKNFVNADIRFSRLSKAAQEQVKVIFYLFEVVFADTEKPFTPEEIATIKSLKGRFAGIVRDELVYKRNDYLFDKFLKSRSKNIVLAWGSAHLPDIEQRLLILGYKKGKSSFRIVANGLYLIVPIFKIIKNVVTRSRKKKG